MRRNLSRADRFIRAAVAITLATLATLTVDGSDRVVLLALATLIALTALTARCPLYALYGFSSVGGLHRESSRCLIDVDGACDARDAGDARTSRGQASGR